MSQTSSSSQSTPARTYVVTGAAGFIGSHVCERLLDMGHTVVGLDNFDDYYDPRVKQKNIDALMAKSRNFSCQKGDIRSFEDLDKLFTEALKNKPALDCVIHLAARAGVRPSIENPVLYMDVNVLGTTQLLECMKQKGLRRLIFASSSSVYGNNKKVPFSESDSVDHPISPYAASKKAGELICHNYAQLFGFDIFCLRFFTVYGPRQRPEMAITLFANKILKNEVIDMYGDGSTRRDYTYIDDIVDGVWAAVQNLKGYKVLNLGGSGTVTLKEMIQGLEKALDRKATIVQKPMQPGEVDQTVADPTLTKAVLGFQPRFVYAEGVKRFCQWLQRSDRV